MTLTPAHCTLDSIAFSQYTGGTTGLSKGAVLTHRNIIAAVLQGEEWFTPALKRVGDLSTINDVAALPPHHIFALTLSLLTIRWGAHLTLIPNPRDFGKFIEVQKTPVSHASRGEHFVQCASATPAIQNSRVFKSVCLTG